MLNVFQTPSFSCIFGITCTVFTLQDTAPSQVSKMNHLILLVTRQIWAKQCTSDTIQRRIYWISIYHWLFITQRVLQNCVNKTTISGTVWQDFRHAELKAFWFHFTRPCCATFYLWVLGTRKQCLRKMTVFTLLQMTPVVNKPIMFTGLIPLMCFTLLQFWCFCG